MKTLIEKMMSGARQFTAFDFAMFKLGLLAAGVLVGACFPEFFCRHMVAVAIFAVACCGWVLYATIAKGFCRKKAK